MRFEQRSLKDCTLLFEEKEYQENKSVAKVEDYPLDQHKHSTVFHQLKSADAVEIQDQIFETDTCPVLALQLFITVALFARQT